MDHKTNYRTHHCNELCSADADGKLLVTLVGWVNRIRNLGYIVWVELRDFYGITQLVFDQQRTKPKLFDKVIGINNEDVLKVKGTVVRRKSPNSNISTGEIEILVAELEFLSHSAIIPFTIENQTDGGLELRMKHRFLDLRRNPIQDNLVFRHKVVKSIREHLWSHEFIEVETPFLIKSTPEGARDFVVPSYINNGQFYALPQSPQMLKQLLVIGGFDKYFQIVKCFRDEDLRSDRQPEFTQLDCELAFVDREDVMEKFEILLKVILEKYTNYTYSQFKRLTYDEAINAYGSDKPDLRFDMKLVDLSTVAKGRGFNAFDNEEVVVGISIKDGAKCSRKQIDSWINWVRRPQLGAKGLVWVKYGQDVSFRSSVSKFFHESVFELWMKKSGSSKGDLLLIMSGSRKETFLRMGSLRTHLADQLDLIEKKKFSPLWIVDFPLFQYDHEQNKYHSLHHPFTAPISSEIKRLTNNWNLREEGAEYLLSVKAQSYDLVLNGNEIGGGSIRISDHILQKNILFLLGFKDKDAQSQFGFLLDALKYGAPPHGGIAWGIDRLVATLRGENSIRDYIAFPKNNRARDLMMDAPSDISETQIQELGLNSSVS